MGFGSEAQEGKIEILIPTLKCRGLVYDRDTPIMRLIEPDENRWDGRSAAWVDEKQRPAKWRIPWPPATEWTAHKWIELCNSL